MDAEEASTLRASYANQSLFRSRIEMKNFGFGAGEYKYFADPLPAHIRALREDFFKNLVPIANRWRVRLGAEGKIPENHRSYRSLCAAAGQNRPTPLLVLWSGRLQHATSRPLRYRNISNPGRDFAFNARKGL
ncbi:MAG TPA: 2OG-Fe(II) oxygenase [Parvularculaceae bacterium]|nr:2OG-Fe(II) oxygenase [Parvularculaceae bacterium]